MSLLSPTSASVIAGLVEAMNEAADALKKHQGQAARVRTKSTRTTVTGPGGTKSALPTNTKAPANDVSRHDQEAVSGYIFSI